MSIRSKAKENIFRSCEYHLPSAIWQSVVCLWEAELSCQDCFGAFTGEAMAPGWDCETRLQPSSPQSSASAILCVLHGQGRDSVTPKPAKELLTKEKGQVIQFSRQLDRNPERPKQVTEVKVLWPATESVIMGLGIPSEGNAKWPVECSAIAPSLHIPGPSADRRPSSFCVNAHLDVFLKTCMWNKCLQ